MRRQIKMDMLNYELNFITLMPKKDKSKSVLDYRPISLVISVCKIITKLSLWFNEDLDDTVSPNQGASMGGGQILDAFLIANAVVEYMHVIAYFPRHYGKSRFPLK